jgi:2-polyprenyl-3-methyl-5-hydroxy-6-metoxy-1,4-benzoquinol methylase
MLRIRQGLSHVQGVRQRLQDHVQALGQGSDTEKRLARELQEERERRRRAESRLSQRQDRVDAVADQPHALPEPDTSMNKLRIFRTLLPSLKPGRMLDLGSGKGNFSVAAAEFGWEVTAVDARTVRWPDPETEEDPEIARLVRSIKWVVADVREFPISSGEYDLICILGLLHHLEVDDQIKLLRRCSGTLTLLDTRIAPRIASTVGAYEGRYRREHGETQEEREQIPTASWGNDISFQHTEESLLRLVQDCGYSKLMAMKPPHRRNYTFYLCLPAYSKEG